MEAMYFLFGLLCVVSALPNALADKCYDEGVDCAKEKRNEILDIIATDQYDMEKICPIVTEVEKCFKDETPSCSAEKREDALSYTTKFCKTGCRDELKKCNEIIKKDSSKQYCCELGAVKKCGAFNDLAKEILYDKTCAGCRLGVVPFLTLMAFVFQRLL
ncbi:DgyrCDS14380 [Dimorphilus gyrociliatus]|uniref:DgyrCDS14378 n=1 Tax=Dimorphilus gyrociliatus TaxID=2664684 RepID=A0A7I8WDK9_9ANNE|nr:DgyrCDS14378 [Dimorphilus gyrociliatus]CAD5126210.1 DgyrCDS14380 [Dimorphilus gyrociliatus]